MEKIYFVVLHKISLIVLCVLFCIARASGNDVIVIGVSPKDREFTQIERPSRGASYVIIVPRDFLPAIMPLANLRQRLGHQVACITVEAIQSHFSQSCRASILQFLQHACNNWPSPKVKFVLLAADTQIDSATIEGIPTWYILDYKKSTLASDYPYCQSTDDPNYLAMGRLPAQNVRELQIMVSKILRYEENRRGGLWQRRISFVAGEGGFGRQADMILEDIFTRFITSFVPASWDVNITYANPNSLYFFPPSLFPDIVATRLNQGALFFVYVGHGSKNSLGNILSDTKRYSIFNQEHIPLVSIHEGMPLLVSIACYTGFFDSREDNLGEAMIKMSQGPVAFVGASEISHPYGNVLLGKFLLEGVFRKRIATAGELLQFVRQQLQEPPGWDLTRYLIDQAIKYFADADLPLATVRQDHVHMYNLLGDPALRIGYPIDSYHFEVQYRSSHKILCLKGAVPNGMTSLIATLEIPVEEIIQRLPKNANFLEKLHCSDQDRSVIQQYLRANHKILVEKRVSLSSPTFEVDLAIPDSLIPDEYLIKVALLGEEGMIVGYQKWVFP